MTSMVYLNPAAEDWAFQYANPSSQSIVLGFHQALPGYNETRLHSLPSLAAELQLGHVLLKDESDRFGLPAFKIVGASWAVYRAIADRLGFDDRAAEGAISIKDLSAYAKEAKLEVYTTTEGNWGRAVARMCTLLGVKSRIFVPQYMVEATQNLIRSEGAEVVVVPGKYDDCCKVVIEETSKSANRVMVVDAAWEGYEKIPQWVVEGYGTLLAESEKQALHATHGWAITHAIVPVGVGSIAQAVTENFKSSERRARDGAARVIAVEPTTAASLKTSLENRHISVVSTGNTIMRGMNCSTVSTTAWPVLKPGIDASIVVTDQECHAAVQELKAKGILAGPCGAATLAALKRACAEQRDALGLNSKSVVVLYCTEGPREYEVPC